MIQQCQQNAQIRSTYFCPPYVTCSLILQGWEMCWWFGKFSVLPERSKLCSRSVLIWEKSGNLDVHDFWICWTCRIPYWWVCTYHMVSKHLRTNSNHVREICFAKMWICVFYNFESWELCNLGFGTFAISEFRFLKPLHSEMLELQNSETSQVLKLGNFGTLKFPEVSEYNMPII